MYCLSESDDETCYFDDILDKIGGFGPWQKVIFALICFFDVFGAFSMLIPVFTGKQVPLQL